MNKFLEPPITKCVTCPFSVQYNNNTGSEHEKDDGYCSLNIIEKFDKIEIDPDNAGHFQIPGRICPYLRNDDWLDKYISDLHGQVRKECTLKATLVINHKGCGTHYLEKTLKTISSRYIKNILVLDHTGLIRGFNLSNQTELPWTIYQGLEDDITQKIITKQILKQKSLHFYYIESGISVSVEMLSYFNNEIYSKINQLAILSNCETEQYNKGQVVYDTRVKTCIISAKQNGHFICQKKAMMMSDGFDVDLFNILQKKGKESECPEIAQTYPR